MLNVTIDKVKYLEFNYFNWAGGLNVGLGLHPDYDAQGWGFMVDTVHAPMPARRPYGYGGTYSRHKPRVRP